MTLPRRTWLATALFALVSTAVWANLSGWGTAWKQLLPTLLVTPVVWWFMAGRHARPHLMRGALAGGLAGFITQSAQDVPKILGLYAQRGSASGEDQAVAVASVTVYLLIGVCATLVGALLGLVAVVVQRRTDGAAPA